MVPQSRSNPGSPAGQFRERGWVLGCWSWPLNANSFRPIAIEIREDCLLPEGRVSLVAERPGRLFPRVLLAPRYKTRAPPKQKQKLHGIQRKASTENVNKNEP